MSHLSPAFLPSLFNFSSEGIQEGRNGPESESAFPVFLVRGGIQGKAYKNCLTFLENRISVAISLNYARHRRLGL
jgi:hypothetical protein